MERIFFLEIHLWSFQVKMMENEGFEDSGIIEIEDET